jgi:pimeloyl-ACP methyl ester carboxylesterase
MPKIEIRGVPHFYELTELITQSSSPVLIFIHGWLLSRNYWRPLINQLAPYYRCLSYDLRGFGDSQPDTKFRVPLQEGEDQESLSCYSLAAYAEDLKILLAKLEIEQGWLIGHSLGGSIAIWGANLDPHKVNGVICINAGGGIYLKEEFERFRNAGKNLINWRQPWLKMIPFVDLLFARTMVARPLSIHWGRQRLNDFLKANSTSAIGSLLDSTTEREVHLLPQIVSSLPQPVYFLAGEKDLIMETKYVRHLASFHPLFAENALNVLEIPDCGHFAMLEQTEFVSEKIREIVQKNHHRR